MLTLSCGTVPTNSDIVGILAARAVENAVYHSVCAAKSLHGKPAMQEYV
ncbi:MAG: hypothetical protein ACTTKL_00195 [Treponema sp.]